MQQQDIEDSVTEKPPVQLDHCPLSAFCGSCQWIGFDAETQSKMRLERVRNALVDVGLVDILDKVRCVESPHILRYRHRARFQASVVDGKLELGYSKSGTREVVDVAQCPVLSAELEAAYQAVREVISQDPSPDLTGIEITAIPGSSGALVTLNPRDRAPQAWPMIGHKILGSTNHLVAAVAVQLPKKDRRPRQLGERFVVGRTPQGRPVPATSGFLHANLHMADILLNEVIRLCGISVTKQHQIMLLNAGSGLLPWALADAGAHVTAVETNAALIKAAELLPLPTNGMIHFSRTNPKAFLSVPDKSVDVLVVEPMRSGLGELVTDVCNFGAKCVVGVWCSLDSMSAEIATLVTQGGYRVDEVVVVDFFPQTSHIETVIKLSLDGQRPPNPYMEEFLFVPQANPQYQLKPLPKQRIFSDHVPALRPFPEHDPATMTLFPPSKQSVGHQVRYPSRGGGTPPQQMPVGTPQQQQQPSHARQLASQYQQQMLLQQQQQQIQQQAQVIQQQQQQIQQQQHFFQQQQQAYLQTYTHQSSSQRGQSTAYYNSNTNSNSSNPYQVNSDPSFVDGYYGYPSPQPNGNSFQSSNSAFQAHGSAYRANGNSFQTASKAPHQQQQSSNSFGYNYDQPLAKHSGCQGDCGVSQHHTQSHSSESLAQAFGKLKVIPTTNQSPTNLAPGAVSQVVKCSGSWCLMVGGCKGMCARLQQPNDSPSNISQGSSHSSPLFYETSTWQPSSPSPFAEKYTPS